MTRMRPSAERPKGEASRHPQRDAIRQQLHRAALETYGEERTAEVLVEAALDAAATALWRVGAEPLALHDFEPHD
jgi:hypothetical protein